MPLYDQFRATSPTTMLRHLTNRAFVLVAQFRPDQSLFERYSGSAIQNAFFVTSREDMRMSGLACGLACEHYADARLARFGERNAERIKAVRVATHAFGWVHEPPRDLTADEYVNQWVRSPTVRNVSVNDGSVPSDGKGPHACHWGSTAPSYGVSRPAAALYASGFCPRRCIEGTRQSLV